MACVLNDWQRFRLGSSRSKPFVIPHNTAQYCLGISCGVPVPAIVKIELVLYSQDHKKGHLLYWMGAICPVHGSWLEWMFQRHATNSHFPMAWHSFKVGMYVLTPGHILFSEFSASAFLPTLKGRHLHRYPPAELHVFLKDWLNCVFRIKRLRPKLCLIHPLLGSVQFLKSNILKIHPLELW